MKIAIVGGGFYGCFLAYKLSEAYDITLFERESELMSRSATLNQSRLHRGLHYPRSHKTIEQTNYGYEKFKAEFESFVYSLDKNIYAIHRDSKTNLELFQKAMQDFSIPLIKVEAPAIIKYPDSYLGFIETDEMIIDLGKIKHYLENYLKSQIIVKLNTAVNEIVADTGTVDGESFDLIINTSYTNPNLGLPKELHYNLYYEMAAMVCLAPPNQNQEAITIVDGNYISLFPNYKKEVTLSSVKYTPFLETHALSELEDCWKNRFDRASKADVQEKIISHAREFLVLKDIKNPHLWIAPKVKLREMSSAACDHRPTLTKKHHKLVSVFCSKLDSVYVILDSIIKEAL